MVYRILGFLLVVLSITAVAGAQETVYTLGDTNIRDCPRLNCAIVVSWPPSTEVTVLGQEAGDVVSDSDTWLLVKDRASDMQGYVHTSLVVSELPDAWKSAPVIPQVSDHMREVYQHGLELGNDPHAFSVVGDCQNVTSYFLADFENPLQYDLGQHQDLQATIDYFAGSFGRDRAAVRGGYNVASVLSPMWADPEQCTKGESPLQCEYRIQKPSFVVISMETWWEGRPAENYEQYLRQVVEFWIDHGVVPILATKADNLEGDHSINSSIGRVAREYDIPLWNFWLAVQPLPNHGLTEDAFHLTYGRPFFGDSGAMQTGWAMRNLTALQVLDTVRRGVLDTEATGTDE